MSSKKQKKYASKKSTGSGQHRHTAVSPVHNTFERSSLSHPEMQIPGDQGHRERMAVSLSENKISARSQKKKQAASESHTIRSTYTLQGTIQEYINDHRGGNHSPKTIEWHVTALGLLRTYLEQERGISLVRTIQAADISGWFISLRTTPGARGKVRTERTVQTYARSARAFFNWLLRRHIITHNPFEEVIFPRVGKPFVATITPEEFERLLLACTPPKISNVITERAAARNQAMLLLFYDTGIRLSELIHLRLSDWDREQGIILVKGKGAKDRRIALGKLCQHYLCRYLDHYRPSEEELEKWGNPTEEHLFLSETYRPLSANGITLMLKRIKKRAGIQGKRISAHIFRHTFAIQYLVLGNDPFSLQYLLGHEDMATVKFYMHMNDATIQEQKRKYSPGDHLSISLSH